MDAGAALEMVNITKAFPGVLANDHISLRVEPGEIHAILGENGAGKTTLMNILYGLYQPQEGQIYRQGRQVIINSPRDAIALGIGMVHQHFMLIPTLTVAENIILGLKPSSWPWLSRKALEEEVRQVSERYGLRIDPGAWLWQLSLGAQQRVEIIKALYRKAEIIILDEPTSVLTPQETNELFSVLRSLTKEGNSVIFISHKLDEVLKISDRITVLRGGKVVATLPTREADARSLARMMVGREVLFSLEKKEAKPGPPILEVERITAKNDMGLLAVKGVSLTLCQGEILGIAGVAGNGQLELAQVVMGLRRALSGRIRIKGKDVTNHTPREIIELGVALIPEDRQRMGLISDFTVAENLILEQFHKAPFSRRGFINWEVVSRRARRLVADFDVRTPGEEIKVSHLSGGNQQKLVLARQFSRQANLLVALQPTRGLDVGATEYVRARLMEAREKGAAILLISADLEEVMALSDRLAVMYEGEIVAEVKPEEIHLEEIGLLMAGSPLATGLRPAPPFARGDMVS